MVSFILSTSSSFFWASPSFSLFFFSSTKIVHINKIFFRKTLHDKNQTDTKKKGFIHLVLKNGTNSLFFSSYVSSVSAFSHQNCSLLNFQTKKKNILFFSKRVDSQKEERMEIIRWAQTMKIFNLKKRRNEDDHLGHVPFLITTCFAFFFGYSTTHIT